MSAPEEMFDEMIDEMIEEMTPEQVLEMLSGMTASEEFEWIMTHQPIDGCTNPRCNESEVEEGLCPVCRIWVDDVMLPQMQLNLDQERSRAVRNAVTVTRREEQAKAKKQIQAVSQRMMIEP